MGSLVLKIVAYTEAAEAIQSIRHLVFQVEQGVDPAIDFDGLDESATHIVAYWNDNPIGTTRIRFLDQQTVKIERVAVLTDYRSQGVGRKMMEAAIAFLDSQNYSQIKVNAQVQVKNFYQKLGFEQQGNEFYEAGISHIAMTRVHCVASES
jgi:predicted GNAT family N-acyltransferase